MQPLQWEDKNRHHDRGVPHFFLRFPRFRSLRHAILNPKIVLDKIKQLLSRMKRYHGLVKKTKDNHAKYKKIRIPKSGEFGLWSPVIFSKRFQAKCAHFLSRSTRLDSSTGNVEHWKDNTWQPPCVSTGYLVFHSFFQLCSLRPKKRPVCATPPSPVPVPTSSSSRPPSPRPYPGRFIAAVSFDGTCCVWRRQSPGEGGGGELSWELTATLEGHENEVRPEDQGGDRWGGRGDGVC